MQRYIAFIILALMTASSCLAQDKIDKLINVLEKKKDVETTYTERRSPKKKKLYRISRILTFSNPAYYSQLEKAFEEERENTISAVKTKEAMTYRFENDKGSSTYTLSSQAGYSGPYTLIQSWKSPDADKLEGYSTMDDNIIVIKSDFSGIDDNELCSEFEDRRLTFENNKKVFEIRKNAFEARKEAFRAREEAAKNRMKAQKQASEARVKAHKLAAQARREAAKARKEAAKARREAAKAREDAAKAFKNAADSGQNVFVISDMAYHQE